MNKFGSMGLASPLKQKMSKSNWNTINASIRKEIEDYRREIAYKKTKYQEKSRELIAVKTQGVCVSIVI